MGLVNYYPMQIIKFLMERFALKRTPVLKVIMKNSIIKNGNKRWFSTGDIATVKTDI